MTPIIIWSTAVLLYIIFWLWYIGFQRPLTPREVDEYIQAYEQFENTDKEEIKQFRKFLEEDDGKDFVMLNCIQFHKIAKPVEGLAEGISGRKALMAYFKPFAKLIIKRACHPLVQGRAAMHAVDQWGIENAKEWSAGALMRYRSRRDFAQVIINPLFHEKHHYKVAALKKSFAYPLADWSLLGGGPRLTVLLVLAFLAAFVHLTLG